MFDIVTLTLKYDLLLKNVNLGCYIMMVAARRASLSSDNSYYIRERASIMLLIPFQLGYILI